MQQFVLIMINDIKSRHTMTGFFNIVKNEEKNCNTR